MIFDEITFELKEYIFTYFTPNDWINTAKVSNEWMHLTLGCIKRVESCHLLILDHLAEFINQQQNANYSWVSLLTLMPRLEHLECIESTETFWRGISPVCHQLKILDFKPSKVAYFKWKKVHMSFSNLVELLWNGVDVREVFPLNWFACSPKLEKLTLRYVKINSDWKNKIPKSVKHISLDRVVFCGQFSISDICEDSSTLETFSTDHCMLTVTATSQFFDKAPRLKSTELDLVNSKATTSKIIANALRKCRHLETVIAYEVKITRSWRRLFPESIKSIYFWQMDVQANIRSEFSFDWLLLNYNTLESLQMKRQNWTGFDPQKFYSTENLKNLLLDNDCLYEEDESMNTFSDICARMIRCSHLVDVELYQPPIDESWGHIFPPTIKRLKQEHFDLTKEAQLVFSPQFVCENPSNIEILILSNFCDDLPAMDLSAFSGMHMLQELHLNDLRISGQCLQSILTHCSALTDLTLHGLPDVDLSNIPQNSVLSNLRKLNVIEAINQPSLLLQHFPKALKVDIAIDSSLESFSDVLNALQLVETVEIKIRRPSPSLLRLLVESIDGTRFKYFCLSYEWPGFGFHLTNSLIEASRKLYCSYTFQVNANVLWINNYPTSSLLRSTVTRIPSSMNELLQRYDEIMEPVDLYASPDSDNKEDDD